MRITPSASTSPPVLHRMACWIPPGPPTSSMAIRTALKMKASVPDSGYWVITVRLNQKTEAAPTSRYAIVANRPRLRWRYQSAIAIGTSAVSAEATG